MAKLALKVVTFEGDVEPGALTKFFDAVFPSPHPPVENIRASNDGLLEIMAGVMDKLKADEPFRLHVSNRADELRKSGKTAAPKPGPKPKPKATPTKTADKGDSDEKMFRSQDSGKS